MGETNGRATVPRASRFNRFVGAVAVTSALAATAPGVRAGEDAPRLVSELPGATVTISLPSGDIGVGHSGRFTVSVVPAAGGEEPARVRARLGMPDHGHWITEESDHDSAAGPLRFPAEFPMSGVYRFRVWLAYPDGREEKTAVDFLVEEGQKLAPRVVD